MCGNLMSQGDFASTRLHLLKWTEFQHTSFVSSMFVINTHNTQCVYVCV